MHSIIDQRDSLDNWLESIVTEPAEQEHQVTADDQRLSRGPRNHDVEPHYRRAQLVARLTIRLGRERGSEKGYR